METCIWKVPSSIHLFKVNNGDTRIMNQICSKLIKKRWWRYWPRSGVVIVVNFEILAIPKRSPIYDVHKKIPTNDPPTSIIPKNGQKLKFWEYQTRFDSKLFFYISIVFEVTHLLRPPKTTNKWPPPPSTHTHTHTHTNTHIHTHTHTHTHTNTHSHHPQNRSIV